MDSDQTLYRIPPPTEGGAHVLVRIPFVRYLLNQRMDYDETCTDTLLRERERADLVD